jgi:ATP-dependent exoDNAse (exonuclease V) beta subunit
MDRVSSPGFHFFSCGNAWERAFAEAVAFLDNHEKGILVYGPAIGASGKAWVEERLLAQRPLRFGSRTTDWREWVRARARAHALGRGLGFRQLSVPAAREFFRSTLSKLEEAGALEHLPGLWREERFFSSFLSCVEEARLAGLSDEEEVFHARDLLGEGADPVTRAAYDDFWKVLLAYEAKLGIEQQLDEAAILRLALESEAELPPLFLLGFDHLPRLAADLLQSIARREILVMPFPLSQETIEKIAGGRDADVADPPSALLRALVTGFSGALAVLPEKSAAREPGTRYFLSAHAPSEEARSAGALAAFALKENAEVRVLCPRGWFGREYIGEAFREEMGLPAGLFPGTPLERPAGRLFFQVLELKRENYRLAHALELAELLRFSSGRFSQVPMLAARAGMREGLFDWKTKAEGNPELEAFAAILDEIDRLLPERGRAVVFASAVLQLAELCGIAELARRAEENEVERDAHATLAAMVRNAQLLAAGCQEELSFDEWILEWKALLERSATVEEARFFPDLQFYSYGEWLPPAEDGALTLALGFDSGVGPAGGFSFYLEESARRKLGDLLLPTQSQKELGFFEQMRRLACIPRTVFSFGTHDALGKEQQPHWISSALPMLNLDWPELARPFAQDSFRATDSVRTPPPALRAFSASLLELYKECPFKAFAMKVLRLEDRIQASSLDISDLARGNIVHKTLELYYGECNGKEIRDPAERSRVLDDCLARAVAGQKIEYFKGGARLLDAQVRWLRELLLEFLVSDAANYAEFPFFGRPLVEHKVAGMLGGKFSWEGKVDRVDVDEENRRFLVLDYKSGATTPSSTEVAGLERFQLQLYMDAMEAEKPGYSAAGGLYVSLKTGDRKQGLVRKEFNRTSKSKPGETNYYRFAPQSRAPKAEADFQAIREATRAEALRIAESVEAGIFDPAPISEESCLRCEARPACRIRELGAPERQPWQRNLPEAEYRELLTAELPPKQADVTGGRGFNEEQSKALSREGSLVFIEASAGTGKTTVIVEKVRRFLAARLEAGDAPFRAIERFAAISFTDKSAQELGARLGAALIASPGMGPRMAAQAIRQVSTIHGFCRRLLVDFPVEAEVSPMAELMDERAAESLREDAFDSFFLEPPEAISADLDLLLAEFPRRKLEGLLRKLLDQRLLLAADISLYESWIRGERESPGNLVAAGEEKEALGRLLRLSRAFGEVYDDLKKERELLDFNDLEALALRVLGHEHCRDFYRERFSLLLVDEFQDTNSVQREILERLARPGWSNLFVVGDAKQSIYRFRAADVSVFQGLRADAEKRGELVTLFRNYRSRRELVDAANRVTQSIFPAPGSSAPDFEATAAEAWAGREGGGRLSVVEFGDPEAKLKAEARRELEADLLVRLVQEQLAGGRRPGSIAILLRKISSNTAFLEALTCAGIPFRVGSSRGFYAQQAVLDALALLRALYAGNNEMALFALLRSPWVRMADARILELQKKGRKGDSLWSLLAEADAPRLFAWKQLAPFLSCSELLVRAFRHYPLDRREHLQLMKLLAILGRMEEEGKTRSEMIERLSLWAGWESEDSSLDDSTMPEPGDGGAVQIMTVHASKGLEFDVTILPDLGSGLLPDRSALRLVPGVGLGLKLEDQDQPEAYGLVGERNKEREIAESKRLLYVALTRAKEECVLLLPREAEGKKRKETWADMLRESRIAELAVRRKGEEVAALAAEKRLPAEATAGGMPMAVARVAALETSITEMAALQFCPEFHRRKFVQGWDDQVVALWPADERAGFALRRAAKGEISREREEAGRLLKALELQRKERGIALHRVLERQKGPALDVDLARLWLREAYEAQGADSSREQFEPLLDLDVALLGRFLGSDLGRELFTVDAEAFPEIPFRWRHGGATLHGAIDRLIRKPSGLWVVVDYKSSVLEESRERYEFQVASYMAAVAAHARLLGEEAPRVEGYLVDLQEASAMQVKAGAQTLAQLAAELSRTREAYTLARSEALRRAGDLQGGDHCFKCAYCLHCEIGLKALRFK